MFKAHLRPKKKYNDFNRYGQYSNRSLGLKWNVCKEGEKTLRKKSVNLKNHS